MARSRRPNAFEVSFPNESAPREATSLQPDTSNLRAASLKRKNDALEDTREPKRRQLPPTAHYVGRGGQLESANLEVVGEDPFEHEDDPTAKPVRVLSDFVIYDPKHRNEMILLSSIEEEDGVAREFEAEGLVSPYYQNDEDEGQEDDDASDSGNIARQPKMVRLGAIMRYTFDHTETDGKVYIETEFAWYILDAPFSGYTALYQHFFTPLQISQLIITAVLKSPRLRYDEFIQRFVTKVDPFGRTYQEKHLLEVLPNIREAINECEEYDRLKDNPLIRHILAKSSAAKPRIRRKHALSTRGKPPPIIALTGNLDIALLARENAVPTHVTPLIASLAQGLVSEELVVVGARPQPEPKTQKERQKAAEHKRLCQLILKAKQERRTVERIGRNSNYPQAVKVNGDIFQAGDFVLIPRKHSVHKGHYQFSDFLPDDIQDVDPTSTIADYFWFAQIVYCSMNPSPGHFHVHWLQHSTQTMMEELGHPQELFWNEICENVPWGAVIDKIVVHENSKPSGSFDEYFVKFVYDIPTARYVSTNAERRALFAANPAPDNCFTCAILDQRDQECTENRLRDDTEHVNGVSFRGQKYHYEDFVLYRAKQGPAHLGYVVNFRIISNTKVQSEVYLRRVGRISSIGTALPNSILRDERHVYLTDEVATVPLKDLIRVCHVFNPKSFNSKEQFKNWLAISPYHFYIKYSFPSISVNAWSQRKSLLPTDLHVCMPCTQSALEELKDMEEFLEDAEDHPFKTLDIFGGVGAFSMGLEEGSRCMEVTDIVELAPSAAKTVLRNFPNVTVHNRCANEVLRYAIKEKMGQRPDPLQQHYDQSKYLSPLEWPDVIVAGVPCQTHSRLNQYKRAGDKKSNLILTALSFVDHFRPKYFYFENVPGFKEFTFDAVQATEHTVEGGIPMGGLKFVVRALIEMQYQVSFAILQAGHYGTPQRRHRFFLVAALEGHPLPELPQPSHDFPDNYGLGIKFPSDERVCPIWASNGTAPHPFVSIDDAISDLHRFDWKAPKTPSSTATGFPTKICDPASLHCGYEGVVPYQHEARTSYQEAARCRATENLQHFTRTFKPEKVKRVIAIPLRAGADYRSLPANLHEWQISNPLSSVGKKNFRPGIYGRLDQHRFFPTTVTNMDTTAKQSHVLNPYCHRMVTVRELARSQGFPDYFVFEASDNGVVTMHRQIGNAVPLPVGIALGRELRKARFKKWLEKRQNSISTDDSE